MGQLMMRPGSTLRVQRFQEPKIKCYFIVFRLKEPLWVFFFPFSKHDVRGNKETQVSMM